MVARRIVIVGSDSPTLPDGWLDLAWRWLADVPVVLGPAFDGGYYLIGISRSVCDLWSGIDWGSPEVLACTIERLEQSRTPYRLLPMWYDVDRQEDLQRLAIDLRCDYSADPLARRLLAMVCRLMDRAA